MKRLTFEGNFCDIALCLERPGGEHCGDGACSQRKVWERLKEYEDREEQEGKDTNVPTNADRIRAMSDEELAVFMSNEKYDTDDRYITSAWWLKWLQQPCEGGADRE